MNNPDIHPSSGEEMDLPPDLAGGKGTFSEFDYTDEEATSESDVWIYTESDPQTTGVQVASTGSPAEPNTTIKATPNWVDCSTVQVWIKEGGSQWWMYACATGVDLSNLQFHNTTASQGAYCANNEVDENGNPVWHAVTATQQANPPAGSGIS